MPATANELDTMARRMTRSTAPAQPPAELVQRSIFVEQVHPLGVAGSESPATLPLSRAPAESKLHPEAESKLLPQISERSIFSELLHPLRVAGSESPASLPSSPHVSHAAVRRTLGPAAEHKQGDHPGRINNRSIFSVHVHSAGVAGSVGPASPESSVLQTRVPLLDVTSVPPRRWQTIIAFRDTVPGYPHAHINVRELRAVGIAVRWAVSSPAAIGSRLIVLGDSLVALGALRKGRSSSFQLQIALRPITALLLAANVVLHLAYIPTELNPADAPSRRPDPRCRLDTGF